MRALLTPAGALRNAGLWRRTGSMLYELLLLVAIFFVAGWVFLLIGQILPANIGRPLLQIYLLTISAAYFVYCWTHGGQTLPMKTWRIRLVDRKGGSLSARLAIKRYLLALLSLALCGAGFLWAIVDQDRQFLHDRLAGTRIINTA